MARTRISKIAKDLNIAVSTAVEFLRKKNIEIDDNPNTRIEDNIVDLLIDEFDTDGARKANKTAFLSNNKEKETTVEKKPQPQHVDTVVSGPKVIGKVEIDAHGNVVKKPAATEAPKAERPAPVEKPAPVVAEPAPKPAPAPEVKVEKPAAPAPAAPVSEPKPAVAEKPAPVVEKKPEVKPVEAPKAEAPQVKKEEPAPVKPAVAETKPAVEKKEEEIFTLGTHADAPKVNVIGKIDLSTLNQSTRPKKKSKEERRNERNQRAASAAGAPGSAQGSAERKKRRRIGKEKIDIEKIQPQGGGQGQRPAGQSQRDNAGNQQRRDKGAGKSNKRQQHVEINEEDVQKQVKETLARLTSKDKGQKKAAKWRKEKREAFANREREAAEMADMESRTLKLTEFVTANDLASMMDVPINQVIATCMNIGVMVSINQRLDAETINIVAEEFGFKTEYVSAEVVEAIQQEEDTEDDLMSRPPIVTVMGHVDHGKTSLLDYIRSANVIAGEAGGITQHIGAYHVRTKRGEIVFLDTPGHEAFTAMRARGAQVTDLVILVVAADDGVMEQTREAINHSRAANVPIVVAVNKMDKPGADPDRVLRELAELGLQPEDWGGDTIVARVSAKTREGLDELLELVALQSEIMDLKANPDKPARGHIVEARLDKGRGAVATVLVQEGTLKMGDNFVCGPFYGRVRALTNDQGKKVKEAGPSLPVEVQGFEGVPEAGEEFLVVADDKLARRIADSRAIKIRERDLAHESRVTLETFLAHANDEEALTLNLVLKADVQGSLEAITEALLKQSTDKVKLHIVHGGTGAISESDIMLASASRAIIIGFNVRPTARIKDIAERENVDIRFYDIIYKLVDDIKNAMAGLLAPVQKEVYLGQAEIRQIFHLPKIGNIAGSYVMDGKITRNAGVRLLRDGVVVYTGKIASLKRHKDDAREVVKGNECGIGLENFNDIKEGDLIEAFETVEEAATL